MISKHRSFVVVMAAALLMLLAFASVASADGLTNGLTNDVAEPICVDGYVINHREIPVDGTKTYDPLMVSAVDASGAVVATVAVGKDGYFEFEKLPAGDYDFQMVLPLGWEGIVPAADLEGVAVTGLTSFAEQEKCYRIVFKIRRLVTVPVLKWEEQLDGTVIPGEEWLITATPVKDPFAKVVTATVTGGQTSITLTPGTWVVAETVKSGWTPLTPAKVTRVIDQYVHDKYVNPIVFKNREPACHPTITVTKFGYGTNPDGGEEPLGPLAGWKFTVSRADKTAAPITKMTAGDGRVVFDNLMPGVYKVTEEVQAGWKARADNPVTVILMDCEEVEISFENEELIGELSISGHKLFKAWEKPYKGTLVGLAGWKITATLVGTETEVSTYTDALGAYKFTEEMLGNAGMRFPGASIEVCEEDRDNWIHVTPECVTVKFPYPVPATYTGAVVNFTNVQDPPIGAQIESYNPGTAACATYHTVVKGDTLAKIAGKYGVSMRGLIAANGIRNADVIGLGQTLCIK